MAVFGRGLGISRPFLGCHRIQSPALQAAGCASCAHVLHILILRYALLILRFAGVRCAVFLFLCCRREGDRSGDDTGNFSVFDLKVDSNLVDDSFLLRSHVLSTPGNHGNPANQLPPLLFPCD